MVLTGLGRDLLAASLGDSKQKKTYVCISRSLARITSCKNVVLPQFFRFAI